MAKISVDDGVNFVEIPRANVPLQDRDVRVVRRTQSEALREDLQQAAVDGLSLLDHRVVRFQRDINGHDRIVFRTGILCVTEQ